MDATRGEGRVDPAQKFGADDLAREVSRRRHIGRLISLVWLGYMYYPIAELARLRPFGTRGVLGSVLLGLFIVVYVVMPFLPGHFGDHRGRPSVRNAVLTGTLFAITAVTVPIFGADWAGLTIYAATISAFALSWRTAVPASLALFAFVLGWALITDTDRASVALLSLQAMAAFAAVLSIVGIISSNRRLRAARAELARMAVSQERLRFSRDLHDLLGHSLTGIVVKSELARKLAERDPGSAVAEIADIEQIARQALVDVRETVNGYRALSLSGELAGARAVLDAAGVRCVVHSPVAALPSTVEALLAWGVREGTTNILRHSGASECEFRVDADGGTAFLEIVDNGTGPAAGARSGGGKGLTGLAERMVAVGGVSHSGAVSGGGFRLRAEVPTS